MARKISILLVDDDPTVRQSLGNLLSSENYHVLQASNSREALREFGENRVDILLLDLHLGCENGWDTFDMLRGIRPNLPVIVITAHPDKYTERASADNTDFMEKPLDLPSLVAKLGELAAAQALCA